MAQITGTNLSDTLHGTIDNDQIYGLDGDDFLYGLRGDDILDGGKGADVMYGAAGNDIYYVDNINDVVTEYANDGHDTVVVSFNGYHLGANVEDLDLIGNAQVGYGNAGDNNIQGNALKNTLFGGDGADALFGFGGNDNLDGGAGNDELIGDDGNDFLYGGAGNDYLDGGTGNNHMEGGTGDDFYIVSSTADVLVELAGGGHDVVGSFVNFALAAELEDLYLLEPATTPTAVTATGNGLDNVLIGNSIGNTLSGLDGNDTLDGRGGNNILDGGNGIDLADYSLAPGSVTINLLNGTGSNGWGGTDTLISIENVNGSALPDTIYAGAGGGTFNGGAGNDIFVANAGVDVFIGGGSGFDDDNLNYTLSTSGVTVNLATHTGSGGYAQGDTYSGNIDFVYGSNYDDTLIGDNNIFNALFGMDGNDTIDGGVGRDQIDGGVGNDTIIGGGYDDQLTGGAGADTFKFTALADSTVAAPDRIFDFSTAEGDKIDLSQIDANMLAAGDQAFTYIGNAAFIGIPSQLHLVGGFLEGDVNGDFAPDFRIQVNQATLAATDFIL